ncbi:MAG: tRNA (N(6)-L-threonylcarbamoyladenosine(37)-C(2))-methylthiotransferase MtaB [Candidatus Margulisbacteria bacterium]|jgi:threonylcarbamoyladenosine tRNA methylthiotransferase MtaB|nr:tRNA (N(6)-L-threonylcarbamoyladenosine(37)-C(2))-methylthiotransferase MtaB [Candidatus Margulisiibacteriota bacterium]
MPVFFYTLGCKSNQYETRRLAEKFSALGFDQTTDVKSAGVIVVNTCSVTHIAERKARNLIRRFRAQNPQARFYVCGCYANIAELDKILPQAIRITQEIKLRPELWGLPGPRRGSAQAAQRPAAQTCRVREFLKIQEGCDNFCSYCIIPYARRAVSAAAPENILAEAQKLIQNNVREIVLTGINLGRYAYQNISLTDILRLLLRTNITRIRLSSLEPDLITDDLLKIIAAEPRLARHLHVPLQSGSDKILRLMNRKYTAAAYQKLIARARRICGADFGLTTDIIVGFPGETKATFQETCAFVQEIGFQDLHIFPYSPRPQTAAAKMPLTCSDQEQKQFCQKLEKLRQKMRRAVLQKALARPLEVLAENNRGGFSSEYAPVKFTKKAASGRIYTAKPLAVKDRFILAEPAHGVADADLHRQII